MLKFCYDDLPTLAGRDLGHSDWLIVDQARIDRFADATDDHQWIHVDCERAAEERGHTIAHGYLTLSLLPRLGAEILEVEGISQAFNCGSNRMRFAAPVPAGSRIRARQRVLSVTPRAGGLQMTSEFIIEREGEEKPACIVEQIALYLPTAPPSSAG